MQVRHEVIRREWDIADFLISWTKSWHRHVGVVYYHIGIMRSLFSFWIRQRVWWSFTFYLALHDLGWGKIAFLRCWRGRFLCSWEPNIRFLAHQELTKNQNLLSIRNRYIFWSAAIELCLCRSKLQIRNCQQNTVKNSLPKVIQGDIIADKGGMVHFLYR